jgi:hypothetical protein
LLRGLEVIITNRKLTGRREILPDKIGVGFSKVLVKNFSGRFWTLDEKVKHILSVSINFLKQKYIHNVVLTRAVMPYLATSVFTPLIEELLLMNSIVSY